MADPSKLYGITLGDFGPQKYQTRSFKEPGEVDDAFRYWVHRCVNINASVAASVPYKLVAMPRDRDAARAMQHTAKPLDRETKAMLRGESDTPAPYSWRVKSTRYSVEGMVEIEQHPILDLLANCNPWVDGYALFESLYADLHLSGRCYVNMAGVEGQAPSQLIRMMPYYIEPIPDPVEFVSGFEYRHGAREETFGPKEVLWVKRFDPTNPWGGRGELQAWADYSDAAKHIAGFNAWLMERHGAPDYVVTGADGMTEDDRRAFRSRWGTLFGRLWKRQETVAFMSGGASLEKLSQTNRELEFTQSSNQVRDFIASGFGVPKPLLATDDVNRANAKEATDQHLRLTIWPLVCRMFDAMNDQLVPLFGGRMLLIPENPIRQDAAERMAERTSRLQSGSSIDELRIEDGLEPWGTPESEAPLVATGLTPLDKLGQSPLGSLMGMPGGPDAGTQPEDGEDDPDDAEDEETPEEPPTARQERAARTWSRCGCGEPESAIVSQLDMLVPTDMPRDLEAVVKRADEAQPEETEPIIEALLPVLRGLRARLDDIAGATGTIEELNLPEAVVAEAIQEAKSGLIGPVGRSIIRQAQAEVNRVSPRIGISFGEGDDLIADYIEQSTDRIARTTVGRYHETVSKRLAAAAREGRSVSREARALARDSNIERYLIDRVARTERQYAQSYARSVAWERSPVVRGKRFVLSSDPCELCLSAASAAKDTVYEPTAPIFEYGARLQAGTMKDGTPQMVSLDYMPGGLMGPPIHPNCRCDIESVLIGE